MDFDARYREKFSSSPLPLFLPENYSLKPRDDQFSLESVLIPKSTSFPQDFHTLENFDLNLELDGLSSSALYSIQPNCLDSFDNSSSFGCLPNFEFYESKPFANHATNNVALVPIIDNQNGVEILGHSQLITPINMISPNSQSYNPFAYYELGPSRYWPSKNESCTTPKTNANLVSNHLSTTTMARKGEKDHRKKKTTHLVKGQWTTEEDSLLIELVERYGVRKWSQIAQLLNGRVGKQCRERWHNHLKPDIKKDLWSEEEDRILIKAHQEIGNKWAEIAKKLPGRTENSIKNHWNATKRRQFSRRKCKTKHPKQTCLLQEYIKSLTLETINAGCRKKPISLTDNKSPNGWSSNSNSNSSSTDIEGPYYDYSEVVPDFNFDAQMFEESSIDSLLGYDVGDDAPGLAEIMDDPKVEMIMPTTQVKREYDLVEMINQVDF